jgi:hypothetical protein
LLDRADSRVFVSPGSEDKADAIAARAETALRWLSDILGGEPEPTLFVVGPADWPRVASMPLYGMPHASGDTVVVGTEAAPFWQEILEWFMPHLDTETVELLRRTYGDPPDLSSVFPDLVLVHELTHLFHEFDEGSGESDFPRLWLAELFANVGFYGYFAEVEPDELPLLEAICVAARALPASATPVRALNDMGRSFEFANGAALYCWFEFMLINCAKRIWEAGGRDALREFHRTLRDPGLHDDEISARLSTIHPEAARSIIDWPT